MKKFRKILGWIAALALCGSSLSCGSEGSETPPGGKEEVKVGQKATAVDEAGFVGLTTGNISLRFDRETGSLVSLRREKTELLGGEGGGNFTLYVDTAATDPFSAREDFTELTKISSREMTVGECAVTDIEGGKRLSLTFTEAGGIRVRQTVELMDYAAEAKLVYAVENNRPGSTVVAAVTGQLGGLDEAADYTLFWPLQEGELRPGAVAAAKAGTLSAGRAESLWKDRAARRISYSYPSPLSMTLAQLYNDTAGLYLYAMDPSNEYKRFNFGCFDDPAFNHYDAGMAGACSLSVTQYPYVSAGGSAALYPLVVGAAAGGWYAGADSYRAYKLTQPVRQKSYTQKARDCHAIFAHTACGKNASPSMCYDLSGSTGKNFTADIASQAAWVDEMFIDDMILIGWSDKGFDMNYPDYGFMPAMGTEADFASGLDKAHEAGDKVLPYLNAWAVQQNSDWWATGAGDRAAVKTRAYDPESPDPSDYYRLGEFIAACPGSEDFVSALSAAAERLARCGADGLWLDQLMEMPAALCYDKSHGHRTPATAYGEGMEVLMTAVRGAMSKYSTDYYFVCEGLCDAYIAYVDIPGGMWGRPLTLADCAAPEITRYTIPSKMLGLWNRDDAITTPAEHAIACYLGDPLLMQGGSKNPYSRRYISLYGDHPEIYEDGRFMADKGVTIGAEGVKVSVRAGKNKLAVTAYNLTDADLSVPLTLSLSALGYPEGSKIARVYEALNPGRVKAFSGERFTAEVGRGAIMTYIAELA